MNIISEAGYTEISEESIKSSKEKIRKIFYETEKFRELEEKLVKSDEYIPQKKKEKETVESEIKMILNKNNSDTPAMLKDMIIRTERHKGLIFEKDSLTKKIREILGNNTLKDLEEKAEHINRMMKSVSCDSLERITEIYGQNIMKHNTVLSQIQNSEREIIESEKENNSLRNIDEEINYLKNNKVKTEKDIKLIRLSLEKIVKASEILSKDFMELLPEKSAEYLVILTGGKYNGVDFGREMDLKVIRNEDGKKIDVEMLSYGTIDQVYFAVRLAVMDILSGDRNIPLFMDDCFIKYDKSRLEKAMELMCKIASNRQILLFTCHNREKELLDKINADYNFIQL